LPIFAGPSRAGPVHAGTMGERVFLELVKTPLQSMGRGGDFFGVLAAVMSTLQLPSLLRQFFQTPLRSDFLQGLLRKSAPKLSWSGVAPPAWCLLICTDCHRHCPPILKAGAGLGCPMPGKRVFGAAFGPVVLIFACCGNDDPQTARYPTRGGHAVGAITVVSGKNSLVWVCTKFHSRLPFSPSPPGRHHDRQPMG